LLFRAWLEVAIAHDQRLGKCQGGVRVVQPIQVIVAEIMKMPGTGLFTQVMHWEHQDPTPHQ